jgi:N-methylhydantoinase A/oxoprolinase/acetone carboxylase beta subunit
VYDGSQLGPGAAVTGPALIEELFTVVSVAPGWHCELGTHSSYELAPT